VTVGLGVVWGITLLVMLWQLPVVSPMLLWGSLIFPVYYAALSFVVGWRK